MAARYYIYRNLNNGNLFSVKYKGKVIDRFEKAVAFDVDFRVSAKGRSRCLNEKRRNVHAYAACRSYIVHDPNKSMLVIDNRANFIFPDNLDKISYNPYNAGTFMCEGEPIQGTHRVFFKDGSCFTPHGE